MIFIIKGFRTIVFIFKKSEYEHSLKKKITIVVILVK